MHSPDASAAAPRLFTWQRVRPVAIACFLVSLMMSLTWQASYAVLITRLLMVGMTALLVFGVLERWPRRLPRFVERWALQVIGVAVVIPFATAIAYALTVWGEPKPWFMDKDRMGGFSAICMLGLLIAPWMAIAALLRQIRGEAQRQALAFELERSQYERNALDARLHLLQAQVEPHFLFNTLANVRELVDSGSAQASAVLGSLIAYLRAAVPRLHEPMSTLSQELDLSRAYLEVMHMRMPDRLQFSLHADDAALALTCPPTTLLTLVENAVRHGIDPAEEGGRIDVRVRLRHGRCHAEVSDTGVGIATHGEHGLGTGLENLRERLQLAFEGDAQLRLTPLAPHGTSAEVEFPARSAPA
ncbi:sensor histidine kinase [Agrilutibacter solisilvae]|uniref:Histidine kinase n=1 Tax=Agrilutibacter solisilvae TaxID=2763317 RepID=A0A974Y168_9GAMM|nr:histidine kinase [Lysobacter solisilvae]QSX79424.1 histidine kinase [Lysobacter solisilvae]